ncbi:alpha,alpha-trehalose phosphorylase [Tessaracoccus bendigoensis DSM 12906]|uniref:Alpha,alpha-trehalose phosphorylase n=1 Tax=Tessaracoccus bendigoensis DSM 12906 TaxID=1123357 RepID=A0A1M6C2Q1_9ACTN|nr:glycosyl hydrolase family 65 protein [Tessaracoccus bendigoensis]SHI55091.1 alpha,alpha-trehalose phosphorylase [Tessaracoccus bendigoensis DSM 12906]
MIRDIASDPLDRTRFPVKGWSLTEVEGSDADVGATESLFAVGNGYLGMRGNPEEGRTAFAHGTFINGFHETWPINHAEEAFGFARTGQTIVNVPDAKILKLYVDDEPLTLSVADLDSYERSLDFRSGTLTRTMVWRTPAGKRVRIRSSRMVSFTDRHLALMELEVTMLEGDAPVVISSQLINRADGLTDQPDDDEEGFDPRRAASQGVRILQPEQHWCEGGRMLLGYRTTQSRMSLAVAADHEIETENPVETIVRIEPDRGKQVYRVQAVEGEPIRVRKAVAYHTSRSVPVGELGDRCKRTLDRVRGFGFEHYLETQRSWLDGFWANSDVVIEGQPATQQAVRWSLFQLAQATARSDQQGIAAKGVTGSGYEGHYFWDIEIYLVPFLIYTSPQVARNVLRYRTSLLPQARARAAVMSQRGALFPWRTINGEEASAYYAAGTAQYHIDADVAFAFDKYRDITGDRDFMYREGVAVLVETARLWADLGFWRQDADGGPRFHIHGVTGPDEYTAVVNNNMFTNVMARANLRSAASLLKEMRTTDPASYERACRSLQLRPEEIGDWEESADKMVVLFDETFGIHPQDEKFLSSEMWDLENTPDGKRPLLLHYHPLVIYRFQVVKQADVVLALLLQGHEFSYQEKRADFEYYDPITTGDSSLSGAVQSIIAAEVGYQDMAMKYFLNGLYVDLGDLHSNARDGVHVAAAGGVWASLIYGFAGLRDHDGEISFDPRLPADWDAMTFPLQVRGSRLRVRLEPSSIGFSLEVGEPVGVTVRGERVVVEGEGPVNVQLDGQGERLESLKGSHPIVGLRRADGSVVRSVLPEV